MHDEGKKRVSFGMLVAGILFGLLLLGGAGLFWMGGGAPAPFQAAPVVRSQPPHSPVQTSRAGEVPEAIPPPKAESGGGVVEVSGMVVDMDDHPLEGARLVVLPGQRALARILGDRSFAECVSGEGGVFMLAGLSSGVPYELSAKLSGYEYVGVDVNGEKLSGRKGALPPGGLSGVKVRMIRTGGFSGVVLDAQGVPSAGSVVRVVRWSGEEGGQGGAPLEKTGEDGRFQYDTLMDGLYRFWVQQYFGSRGPVSIGSAKEPLLEVMLEGAPGGRRMEVTLRLPSPPDRMVEGRVVDAAGRPVEGVQVSADMEPKGYMVGGTRAPTPATGKFRIEGIPERIKQDSDPAEYAVATLRLTAVKGGDLIGLVHNVEVGDRNVEILAVPEQYGTLSCRVYDKLSGQPVGDATVLLGSNDGWLGLKTCREATTDTNGRATMNPIPAGNVELVVEAEGYGRTPVRGIHVRKEETTEADVPLVAAGTLCVQVLAEGASFLGKPVRCSAVRSVTPLLTDAPGFASSQTNAVFNKPFSDIPKPGQLRTICGTGPSAAPSLHQDVALTPGRYRVTVVFSAWDDSGGGGNIVTWNDLCSYSEAQDVQVESGKTTTLVMDVGGMSAKATGVLSVKLGDTDVFKTHVLRVIAGDTSDQYRSYCYDLAEGSSISLPPGEYRVIVHQRDVSNRIQTGFRTHVTVPGNGRVEVAVKDFEMYVQDTF